MAVKLIAFFGNIYLSFIIYPYILPTINKYSQNDLVLTIIGGIISFGLSYILIGVGAHKILQILSIISGGFIDRITGLALGFLRGAVVAILVFVTIAILSSGIYLQKDNVYDAIEGLEVEAYPGWLNSSVSVLHLQNTSKIVATIFKDRLHEIKLSGREIKKRSVDSKTNESQPNSIEITREHLEKLLQNFGGQKNKKIDEEI